MTKSKSFFHLFSSLPVVSDAASYVTGSYNGIKDKNAFIGCVLGCAERSFFKVSSVAYHISKIAVPYDYLDHLASEELTKVEKKFPIIKKPSKQIWKEFSTCTLSNISGVTTKKKIPNTLSEAVITRVLCVVKTATNFVVESRPVKMVEKIGHKILDKAEEAIEAIIPEKQHKPKQTKWDSFLQRISEIYSRTKANLKEVAKEIAELKRKHHHHRRGKKEHTCAELIEALEHLLSKYYKELRSQQWPEKILDKTNHFIIIVTTGTLQSISGTVKATIPALEKLMAYVDERTQLVIKRSKENNRYFVTEAYMESKVFLNDSIETIKKIHLRKIPVSTVHALELFWGEITNEDFTFSFIITESLTFSARTENTEYKEYIEDTTKMEIGDLSKVSSEQVVSTSAMELLFGSSSPEESLKSFEQSPYNSELSDQRKSTSDSEKSSEYFDPFQSKATLMGVDSTASSSFWRRFKF